MSSTIARSALAAVAAGAIACGALSALKARGAAEKNWTPPSYEMYAQTLADRTMQQHPELLSVTFHGVPPGTSGVYTMFAGSYPKRIGNHDDPDDIDVQTKGITIVDPRWHRPNDAVKKFVVQLPLRNSAGENIGLVVYAFKDPNPQPTDERKFYVAALDMRDALEPQIPSFDKLFAQVK